uniref:Uncharacterized protein n=1 Tax=Eutreptiella gymnastica TaxID=73025 RepID=A0A7S1N9N0_9EUGL
MHVQTVNNRIISHTWLPHTSMIAFLGKKTTTPEGIGGRCQSVATNPPTPPLPCGAVVAPSKDWWCLSKLWWLSCAQSWGVNAKFCWILESTYGWGHQTTNLHFCLSGL